MRQGFGSVFWSVSLSLLLSCLSLARAETVPVFGDSGYAPVIYLEDGRAKGTLVDILKAVGRKSGDDFEFRLVPWKRAYESSQLGQGGLVGVSLTSERSKIFDFSEPIYSDDIQIVVLKGREFPFRQLSDLKGKTLGGVLGASYGEEVDRAIKEGLFAVDRDIGQASRLLKLLAGRFDGALVGNGQAGFEAVLQSSPELLANRNKFKVLNVPLTHDLLYLAIPKSMNKADVITRFNGALRQLQKTGELKRPAPAVTSGS